MRLLLTAAKRTFCTGPTSSSIPPLSIGPILFVKLSKSLPVASIMRLEAMSYNQDEVDQKLGVVSSCRVRDSTTHRKEHIKERASLVPDVVSLAVPRVS